MQPLLSNPSINKPERPFPDIEYELMPDFDTKMNTLIENTSVDYLDLKGMRNNYQYADGNHLYKTSGRIVSDNVAPWAATRINHKP